MAHAFHEDHQHYFPHGCIMCEVIHRLSALEGVVDDMSSAWSEQSDRFTSYVSELKDRFDSLHSQIQTLTDQVQNSSDVDSAVAEQAQRDAEQFKNQLDQLDQAFDLNEPGGGSSTGDATSGGGGDTGGAPSGGDQPPEQPPGPVDAGTQDPNAPVDPNSPDASGSAGPGQPDQVPPEVGGVQSGETAPEGGTPVPPQNGGGNVDPNDPNAQQPSSAPDSPGADPTQQVPGS